MSFFASMLAIFISPHSTSKTGQYAVTVFGKYPKFTIRIMTPINTAATGQKIGLFIVHHLPCPPLGRSSSRVRAVLKRLEGRLGGITLFLPSSTAPLSHRSSRQHSPLVSFPILVHPAETFQTEDQRQIHSRTRRQPQLNPPSLF